MVDRAGFRPVWVQISTQVQTHPISLACHKTSRTRVTLVAQTFVGSNPPQHQLDYLLIQDRHTPRVAKTLSGNQRLSCWETRAEEHPRALSRRPQRRLTRGPTLADTGSSLDKSFTWTSQILTTVHIGLWLLSGAVRWQTVQVFQPRVSTLKV